MTFLTAALLLSAVASPAGGFVPSSDEFKCGLRPGGDPGMPEVVILLDHEVYDGEPDDLMALADDIAYLEVVCWRWIRTELRRQGPQRWLLRSDEGMDRTDPQGPDRRAGSARRRPGPAQGADRRIRRADRGVGGFRRPVRLWPAELPRNRPEQNPARAGRPGWSRRATGRPATTSRWTRSTDASPLWERCPPSWRRYGAEKSKGPRHGSLSASRRRPRMHRRSRAAGRLSTGS